MLKQGLNNKYIGSNCLFNGNKKTSKIMVRYMFKLSSITYKALIELIDGNQKTAAVVAKGVGRLTGLGPALGFVVLANSAWRTEIKPKLIPFLNDNLLVTRISLVSAYNIGTGIEYSGLPNQDNEGAKNE